MCCIFFEQWNITLNSGYCHKSFSTISFSTFLSSRTIAILSKAICVSNGSEKFEKQCLYPATKMNFQLWVTLYTDLIPEMQTGENFIRTIHANPKEQQLVDQPFFLKCAQHFAMFLVIKPWILSKANRTWISGDRKITIWDIQETNALSSITWSLKNKILNLRCAFLFSSCTCSAWL